MIEHFSTSSTQPIVFLGHSWGAMYATWFINEHGDYGGRVVGGDPQRAGRLHQRRLDDYLRRMFPPWGLTSEELNDVAWSDQFMSPSDHARADFMQAMAVFPGLPKEHNDPNNRAPFWRLGAVVNAKLLELGLDQGFDWTTHLGQFPHKVLFLRGELNENMPLAHQQELASHYASSEVITVRGRRARGDLGEAGRVPLTHPRVPRGDRRRVDAPRRCAMKRLAAWRPSYSRWPPRRAPSAQELNLATTSTARPNILAGAHRHGPRFLGEVGYRRVLAWGDRQLFVGGDAALPVGEPDLGDYRVRATVGLPFGAAALEARRVALPHAARHTRTRRAT